MTAQIFAYGWADTETSAGGWIMDVWPCPTLAALLSFTQILPEHKGRCRTQTPIQVKNTLKTFLLQPLCVCVWGSVNILSPFLWQCVDSQLVSTAMPHLWTARGVHLLRCRRQPGRASRHRALSRSERVDAHPARGSVTHTQIMRSRVSKIWHFNDK